MMVLIREALSTVRLWLPLLMATAGLLGPRSGEVQAMEPVREPAVAGYFYPRDPDELRTKVEGFLKEAKLLVSDGPPIAILAPHAGYVYSGPVAGWSYRQVMGQRFETVVVLSPSHRFGFKGISVWPKGSYRTPLGTVPVDEEVCAELMRMTTLIRDIPQAHENEHALEVQIPFLQVALQPGWKLVPLVMGSQDLETAKELSGALKKVLEGRSHLVVASSDLSHFHSAQRAEEMDRKALTFMEGVDPEGLWKEVSRGSVEACGVGPVLTVLCMVREMGVKKGKLLRYNHSGDVSGDRTRVVGYGAMSWGDSMETGKKKEERVGVDLGLSREEKDLLKEIARKSIETALQGLPPPSGPEGLSPKLKEPRGAFVTLQKGHRLRGCIGFIQATKPLHETVKEMARAAAFDDPRFPPLTKEEWPEVDIEISVLTPLERVEDVSKIKVGVHGIYIVKGARRGLLLPQVAVEYGWDRETFLEQTCLKAGLPPDAWKDPKTEIYVFSADVF
jgi:AmmeMemoRadiSam system protein B/AmmeMemoRadiSam system protein A